MVSDHRPLSSLFRSIDVAKHRRHIVWTRGVIALESSDEMGTTKPAVLCGSPVLLINSSHLSHSSFGICWKAIELEPTTLEITVGTSNSTATLDHDCTYTYTCTHNPCTYVHVRFATQNDCTFRKCIVVMSRAGPLYTAIYQASKSIKPSFWLSCMITIAGWSTGHIVVTTPWNITRSLP